MPEGVKFQHPTKRIVFKSGDVVPAHLINEDQKKMIEKSAKVFKEKKSKEKKSKKTVAPVVNGDNKDKK
jgi:hypothetical protein